MSKLSTEEDYKMCYEVGDGAVLWTNTDGMVGMGYYYVSTGNWSDIIDNPVNVDTDVITRTMSVERGIRTVKQEAEERGLDCNDCYLSMQNCKDKSICCEDETGLCDWFEPISEEGSE